MKEKRESVTIESSGHKLFGILHLPVGHQAKERYPVVLLLHGLGGNKSGKSRLFVRLAEQLAQKGYAVLRVDLQGAGDSEGDFENTTVQQQFEDVEAILHFIDNHPNLRGSPLALVGRSFGGLLALHTAAKRGDVKALVLWAPVFDAHPWKEKRKDQDAPYQHSGGALSNEFIREFLALNTQKALLQLKNVPLLHIQGKDDKTIDEYHTKQYEKERLQVNSTTRFIALLQSDHDFSNQEEQKILLRETVEWIIEHCG